MRAPRLRPKAHEVRLVRQHAERAAQLPKVKIEVAVRGSPRGENVNALLVADRWEDGTHDLFDLKPWAAFVQGFEPTLEGDAVLDLWVYDPRPDGELETQVQVVFRERRLAQIRENGRVLWERAET